jgi:hypothetical protein
VSGDGGHPFMLSTGSWWTLSRKVGDGVHSTFLGCSKASIGARVTRVPWLRPRRDGPASASIPACSRQRRGSGSGWER